MFDTDKSQHSFSAEDHSEGPSGSSHANDTASRAVLQVAEVLDEEIEAVGGTPQFTHTPSHEGGSLERRDFAEVLFRFATSAHDLVDVVSDGVDEFSTVQATKIVKGLRAKAHKAVDILTKLTFVAPSVIEELVQEKKNRKNRS